MARVKLYESLDGAEVQESFYNLLSERSLEGLRKRPSGFSLTMKAWQATTHTFTSPTWRRMKKPPPGDLTKYGWLRCTQENLWALEQALEQADKANAEVLVFQTPPNMPFDEGRVKEVITFLRAAVERASSGLLIAWEPRGPWLEKVELLEKVSLDTGAIIVTDYLNVPPLALHAGVAYTRLHGSKEEGYRHKYTDEELETLRGIVKGLRCARTYVMFNNVYMYTDALRFKSMLAGDR